jgi:phosphoribosyl 1,2-cyclic phosphate phosphodiesterase
LIITFLGTGTSQGVPVIACQCEVCQSLDFRDKRLRTSILIQTKGKNFVIDTGPDFRQQMLRERVQNLDAIIFTHEHKDHTAGLDDVRAFNFKQRRDMPIYARKQVIDQLKREFSYIFADVKYPGVPTLEVNEINNHPFDVEGIKIIPVNVLHYKLPVFGFRIGDFSYITDANFISSEEKEKLKGSKILIVNALQINSHISHFTLDEAIDLVMEIRPEKAYFTHISHKLGLHQSISKKLPDHIELAFDGLRIFMD